MAAGRALALRAFAGARGRTIGFGLLFLLASLLQAVAYADTYPTAAERLAFARTLEGNAASRVLYGLPDDLLTVGGYLAYRLGGTVSVFGAVFGVLAGVGALRGEEDAGRHELVLAGAVSRRTAFTAALCGVAGQLALLWLALLVGMLPAGEALGPTAYLALALVCPAIVFTAAGALAAQLVPTRRLAVRIGMGVLALALLLRMVADGASDIGWLRWTTPLGWVAELRAFGDPRPLVLLIVAATTAILLAAAARVALRRDIGLGVFARRDAARPHLRWLGSPVGLAVRLQRGGLIAWLVGVAAFAFVLGVLADTGSSAISDTLNKQLSKLGTIAANTPAGFLGFLFEFFVLAICLFACFELAAIREEEAEGQLETLLALPVDRGRWLAQRLALVTAACALIALAAGAMAWAGAVSQGSELSLWRMLEAGANCLPAALLFLSLGALAFAVIPNATASIAYGLVAAAFLWEIAGSLLEAPAWLLWLSPFHHVALAPAQPIDLAAAAAMLVAAAVCAATATWFFRRRDLVGA